MVSGKTTTKSKKDAEREAPTAAKATKSANLKASHKKWGKQVIDQGFCIIPSILFRAQERIGIDPNQLNVLLQICDYWWDHKRRPYISKETIAKRVGLSARSVQRHMAELEKAGLLRRVERRATNGGRQANEFDLSGLVEKLKKIAPDFEEAKEMKRQAGSRGGIAAARGLAPIPS